LYPAIINLTGEAIIDDKLNDNSDEEALMLFDKFDVSNLDNTRIKKNTNREVIRISFLDLLLNE
tara:strand:- start:160 stop:351 length:192 start_codon:yes stop_codon:yes gene_type:complete